MVGLIVPDILSLSSLIKFICTTQNRQRLLSCYSEPVLLVRQTCTHVGVLVGGDGDELCLGEGVCIDSSLVHVTLS